jgi:tetratricopeptide (TPR) repeat protein
MTVPVKMKHVLVMGLMAISGFAYSQTLQQAISLTKNEEFDKADKAFKALIMAQPANGDNYFYEGENFFNWGLMDSAKAAYQKGISMNATNALNYTGLGKIQWYAGDSKDALDNFYKAKVISKSKDATVLAKIAEAYINAPNKDIRSAIDLLTQALQIDPNNADICIDMGDAYLAQNDGSNAVTYYDKATSINPKSVVGILRLGQLYGRARNYDLSFQYFKKATDVDSTFAPAYREKAEMLYSAQRYDEAIAQYKKYLQLNNALDARARYASFLYLAKKYKESIIEIQAIMMKDSSNAILYRIIAYSQYETGDYKNGLTNINKFFAKAPKSNIKLLPSDYGYQGKLLSKNGQDSLAIVIMKKALDQDPDQAADLTSQIANIYFKDGNYPMAVMYFDKRTKLPQPTVNDYNALGRAAYSNKQYAKGDSAFAIICKYMPDLPLGYLWRAYCNSGIDSTGSQGLAKPFYEQYISKAAKDSLKNKDGLINAYDYLGSYYISQKDFDKAEYEYHKTQELDPNDDKAKKFFQYEKNLKQQPGKK